MLPCSTRLVFLAVLTTTSMAFAEPPAPPETRTVDVRYGWQTLAFDGAALAMGLVETTSSSLHFLGPVAVATYVAGGPGVHLHHGHIDRAAGSLGLRVGMPVVGAFIGIGIADANRRDDAIEAAVSAMAAGAIGMTVGIVGASLLDAFVLARESKVEVIEPRPAGTVDSWSPAIGLGPHHASIGIQGTLF